MIRAGLLAVSMVLGCRTSVESTDPPSAAESRSDREIEHEDDSKAPDPEPVLPVAFAADSRPVDADPPPRAESSKVRGSDDGALYQFSGETFTTNLELAVTIGDAGTGLELRHPGRARLRGDGPRACLDQFYAGDSVGALLADHGELSDGRRLLEFWVSCRQGEDIVWIESVVWLVIDDGRTLSQVWTGVANYHGSHVCATFDNLEFTRDGDTMVLTRTEVGEIYEPGVEYYDCENARQYVDARGTERIELR